MPIVINGWVAYWQAGWYAATYPGGRGVLRSGDAHWLIARLACRNGSRSRKIDPAYRNA